MRARIPEDLAAAEPGDAEEGAAAPGLGQVDAAAERLVERHDCTPGDVARVARRLFAEGVRPHRRMEAVGADHEVDPLGAPVGKRNGRMIRVLLDAAALTAQLEDAGIECSAERGLERGT